MLVLLLVGAVYQPAFGHRAQPVEIYHRAWQLVRDNYYDASYNNQNWNEYEHKYDAQIQTNEDAFKYTKTMLEALSDPYTRLLSPRAFQDENNAIEAHIVGIGINLQQSKDHTHLIITRVIENSPAEKSGMRPGDEIVSINEIAAGGMTPEAAAEHIRGQAGSPIQITVRRSEGEKILTMTRQEITIHAVSARILDNGIGYIQVSTFISNDASREFRDALQKLAKTDGLVLDLRGNPGGLLANALEIADMLLDSGVIVSTISRHGRHTDLASGEPVTHQPIACLVDDDSASASEILAGALKDNGRGIIIGTRTYGKGLVQEINRLPGGAAIHITVSRYLTPAGTDINKIGVIPDKSVEDKNEQVKAAVAYLKNKIASLNSAGASAKPEPAAAHRDIAVVAHSQ